jgi:hypothetical protein
MVCVNEDKTRLPTRECRRCGELFHASGWGNQAYCSQVCWRESRRRDCLACGKSFLAVHTIHAKYCSVKCIGLARRKPQVVRACAHCGEEFTRSGKRKSQRFCSHKCMYAARRESPVAIVTKKQRFYAPAPAKRYKPSGLRLR